MLLCHYWYPVLVTCVTLVLSCVLTYHFFASTDNSIAFRPSKHISIACDRIYLHAAPCHDVQNIRRTWRDGLKITQDGPSFIQMALRWLQDDLNAVSKWPHNEVWRVACLTILHFQALLKLAWGYPAVILASSWRLSGLCLGHFRGF